MARSDLLISLVRAASGGDRDMLKRVVETIVAEERLKRHNVLADRLAENLESISGQPSAAAMDERTRSLFYEVIPRKALEDLILPAEIRDVIGELVEEQHQADVLRKRGLEPRHRLLLAGMPGNGKTSVAEAVARQLMMPMIVIRYESLLRSYLGETSSRLASILDYVRTQRCVLFFDEFETIGKEHGNARESGEMKKIVSSLLLQMDRLPSHVVVIAASSYPEILDRVIWQRFQMRIELPAPKRSDIEDYIHAFRKKARVNFGYTDKAISEQLFGYNFSEIEEFCLDVTRRAVLEQQTDNAKTITSRKLKQWQDRYKLLNDSFHVSEIHMHAIKTELPGSTVEALINDMDKMG